MKHLLIGGHADGRRIELDDRHIPTQVSVPLSANLEAGRPIATQDWYRRIAFQSPNPEKPIVVFVHQSLSDDAVLDRLVERYPVESPAPRKSPAY